MIHRIERGTCLCTHIYIYIYIYISIIIITAMVIVSIIIITYHNNHQENSEALSAHSVWSQAHCPLHCPQYESTVNTQKNGSCGDIVRGVFVPMSSSSPHPPPHPPESGKPTEEAWCLLTIIISYGLPSRKYGDIVRGVCVPMSSSSPPPPPQSSAQENQQNLPSRLWRKSY